MEVKIENGVTIIFTGDAEGGLKNKTGFRGITFYKNGGLYKSELTIKSQKYLLGYFPNFEDAKAIRIEAEKHKEAGNFLEWYRTLEKIQMAEEATEEESQIKKEG